MRLLEKAPLVVNATPRLANSLTNRGLPQSFAGSCERLVTGETFLIRTPNAASIQSDVENYVENEWLKNGRWDNEQVALGEMIIRGYNQAAILDESGTQARFVSIAFPRNLLARILAL